MLARLQTAIALTLLAAAIGWLAHTLPDGRWVAAAAGLLLIGGGHAGVLALEFAWMARLNRADPAPRATRWQLVRAWWGESHAAPRVFLWQQPFRSRRWPDRLGPDARGRRGVLLVHGFVCNRGLWNRWLARLHAAGVPCVAVDLEPVFGSIDDYVRIVEDGVARLEAATGVPPLVVAHSMGGLALRRWRAQPGHAARLAHVVTIGTPHHGTWLARFALTPNGVQMRRRGAWIAQLQQDEARCGAADPAGFTCFHGHCDNIVFPATTATLDGADNRHLAGVAHVHMVEHPAVWDEVWARLNVPRLPAPADRAAASTGA
ncbi:MAG: permease [Rubrivivax sp.]